MLGSGIAVWQICCTTGCRIVVVLYNMSVAGVRVVEFGTYSAALPRACDLHDAQNVNCGV